MQNMGICEIWKVVDATIIWYTNLKPSRICSSKDLLDAFIRKYKYNIDMTPDRMQLQKMCKSDNESFKEYAQRWRDLTTQVIPPMMEREMITMIIDTLSMYQYPPQQYHYSANISPAHYPPPYQPRTPNQPQNPFVAHPRPNTTPNTNQNTNQRRNFP